MTDLCGLGIIIGCARSGGKRVVVASDHVCPGGVSPVGRPVSIKGVVLVGGATLLLRNHRDEWELPGGRPEPGESEQATLMREVREETGLDVDIVERLDAWPYEVLPGRFVDIVAWGCLARGDARPAISEEHREARLFAPAEIAALPMHAGYRRAIERWLRDADRSILTRS